MGNIRIKECGRVFKGVSGKTIDVIGECLVQVSVTPSIQTPHVAVVVPDHLLDTDFLFGADLLGKFDVGWSAASQTFTWANFKYHTGQWPMPRVLRVAGSIRRIRVQHKEETFNKTNIPNIHLGRNITMRKNCVELLKFKVKADDKELIAKIKVGNKDISLLVQNQDGYVYLPIFNIKNGTLRLKAGHLVASLESVSNIGHVDVKGKALGNETEMIQNFNTFLRNNVQDPSFCTVCDSHFEILTTVNADTPEF